MPALPSRPRLEVRHLRLVRAIADACGVTAAARALHLSQSAVSHQLISLERDLGVTLFMRVGKRMVPTAAGERLATAAAGLLQELTAIEHALLEEQSHRRPLRIAVSCPTLHAWAGERLAKYAAAHPRIDGHLVFDARHRDLEALLSGEIELSISSRRCSDRRIENRRLFALDTVVLVPERHRLADTGNGSLAWRELAGETLLIHDLPVEDEIALGAAVGHGRTATRIRRVQLTQGILELTRHQQGIGLLLRGPGADAGWHGVQIRSLRPAHQREFWASWCNGTRAPEGIEHLASFLAAPAEAAAGLRFE